jgi:hypothetical protein
MPRASGGYLEGHFQQKTEFADCPLTGCRGITPLFGVGNANVELDSW